MNVPKVLLSSFNSVLRFSVNCLLLSLQLALAVHSAIENNTLLMETFTSQPLFRYVILINFTAELCQKPLSPDLCLT